MIRMRSILDVADNTGARRASMIGVIGRQNRKYADIGDVIEVDIRLVDYDNPETDAL